jgi:serine/threonine protein kinase
VQTELCAGTLSDRSLREEKVSVAFLLDTLEQIGEALKQMHGLGILHCDIKPENVLVALNPGPQPTSSNDGPGVLKIGDFGQSCSVSEGPQIKDGTEGDCSYMAPELLNDKAEHTGAVDVFSTGLLLFEVASRQQLPQMGPVWHAFRNGGAASYLEGHVPSEVQDIILAMLHPNPRNRPTAQQLIDSAQQLRREHGLEYTYTRPLELDTLDSGPKGFFGRARLMLHNGRAQRERPPRSAMRPSNQNRRRNVNLRLS